MSKNEIRRTQNLFELEFFCEQPSLNDLDMETDPEYPFSILKIAFTGEQYHITPSFKGVGIAKGLRD